MANNSVSETGHGVNISNFKIEIDSCSTFSATDYAPDDDRLTITSMRELFKKADDAHLLLNTQLLAAKAPINERQLLHQPVNKLVTRCLQYLNSTKANALIKADAKTIADDIRGANIKAKHLPDGSIDPEYASQSHQGFVHRTENCQKLFSLLSGVPEYKPNKVELQITSLTKLAGDMKTLNDAIGIVLAPVDDARIARNHLLYDAETGVVDVALAAKSYVSSIFGSASAEFKKIKSIKFTRPKK